VLEALRQGLAEIDAAGGVDVAEAKTRSLMACIEYSHGNLDPEAQALLLCFAPFTGVIRTDLLEPYAAELGKEPALAGLPLGRLGEVLEAARGLGLARRDEAVASFLRPQPALAWFLAGRLAAAGQEERKAAVERAFRRPLRRLRRGALPAAEAKKPEERRVAASWSSRSTRTSARRCGSRSSRARASSSLQGPLRASQGDYRTYQAGASSWGEDGPARPRASTARGHGR
jgi:hypothetical protein